MSLFKVPPEIFEIVVANLDAKSTLRLNSTCKLYFKFTRKFIDLITLRSIKPQIDWVKIRCIKIPGMKIKTLFPPNTFLPHLTYMDVANNLLGVPTTHMKNCLFENCLDFPNLTYLDCSHNRLDFLGLNKLYLPKLKVLLCDNNNLGYESPIIPDTECLSSLRLLCISYNMIIHQIIPFGKKVPKLEIIL